jgi:hypothetical protein
MASYNHQSLMLSLHQCNTTLCDVPNCVWTSVHNPFIKSLPLNYRNDILLSARTWIDTPHTYAHLKETSSHSSFFLYLSL